MPSVFIIGGKRFTRFMNEGQFARLDRADENGDVHRPDSELDVTAPDRAGP